MRESRCLLWQMVGWVAGSAWLGGFITGTWLVRGEHFAQLFGGAFFTLFAIAAAWSLSRRIAGRPQGPKELPPDRGS